MQQSIIFTLKMSLLEFLFIIYTVLSGSYAVDFCLLARAVWKRILPYM